MGACTEVSQAPPLNWAPTDLPLPPGCRVAADLVPEAAEEAAPIRALLSRLGGAATVGAPGAAARPGSRPAAAEQTLSTPAEVFLVRFRWIIH